MNNEKGEKVWMVMLIVSILFIGWTIFTISNGNTILENGVKMWAGSSFDVNTIEERALGFMNMSMVKPLWEELWVGVIGILCALGLKRRISFAWVLGIVWGAALMVNGIVQGLYEVVVINWSMACPQTYIFIVLGIVTLASLLPARKGFFGNEAQAS